MCGNPPKKDPQCPEPDRDPWQDTIDDVDVVRKNIAEQMGMLDKINSAAVRVRSAAENGRTPNVDDVAIMTGYATILVNDMMQTARGCATVSANLIARVFG